MCVVQLAREICLHIRILHPHILSLYAAWKDSKYVYLVLEWAPHGNLFELLVSRGGKLPEIEAARHIIRPLLTSLAFLHSHSWLHRDIKLENVLLDAQVGVSSLCEVSAHCPCGPPMHADIKLENVLIGAQVGEASIM